MVLFAKLIPEQIEASLFALLSGLTNFSTMFSMILGNFFNIFVGCNIDTLEETTWKLYLIQAICALIPLLFVWLVPMREHVRAVQKCFEFIVIYENKETSEQM
jgi:glucan phosphoethanolaminetransferase (alkaline phosphatase superfamily)